MVDETPDQTLPPPVVVRHRPAAICSSLSWALVPTLVVVLGLAALTLLTWSVDALGYGALVVLEPLADTPPSAPDGTRYLVVLLLAVALGPLLAVAGSAASDRRFPGAPAAARGLAVAAAASTVAAGIVVLGLGLA